MKKVKILVAVVCLALVVAACTVQSAFGAVIDTAEYSADYDISTLETEICDIAETEALSAGARIATQFLHNESNINFGITTEGMSIKQAREENERIIGSMAQNLAKLGIDMDNITYYCYSAYPMRDRHNNITGYSVSTHVTVNFTPLIKAPRFMPLEK